MRPLIGIPPLLLATLGSSCEQPNLYGELLVTVSTSGTNTPTTYDVVIEHMYDWVPEQQQQCEGEAWSAVLDVNATRSFDLRATDDGAGLYCTRLTMKDALGAAVPFPNCTVTNGTTGAVIPPTPDYVIDRLGVPSESSVEARFDVVCT